MHRRTSKPLPEQQGGAALRCAFATIVTIDTVFVPRGVVQMVAYDIARYRIEII
jgi:hypothetical protein